MRCLAPDVLSLSISYGLRVGKLKLSQNDLGVQLVNDSDGKTFNVYRDLTELDISFNGIKTLPVNIFNGLHNLRILNLSGNSLRLIEFNISLMNKLSVLDLSYNLFSHIPPPTRINIDKLTLALNISLSLYGNPLQCYCNTLDFLEWLIVTKVSIVDITNYNCYYDNKVVQLETENADKIRKDLRFICSTKVILAVSAGMVSSAIVVIAASIFVYRHKWDIRFFVLQFVIKRKSTYQELDDDMDNYEYDAFVAYHSDDRNWVIKELMKNLEDNSDEGLNETTLPSFRLCIHERDFVPGLPIQENILKSIDSSRKTILVISQKFVTSSWCDYEFQMARMRSIDKARDIIIAILLGPVEADKLFSTTLGKIIRRNTYIEWNDDPTGRNEFWMRLRRAIAKQSLPFGS